MAKNCESHFSLSHMVSQVVCARGEEHKGVLQGESDG